MKYKIVNSEGKSATIEAARFESDGAGYRFFDKEGTKIADFRDGTIRSVTPETLEFK